MAEQQIIANSPQSSAAPGEPEKEAPPSAPPASSRLRIPLIVLGVALIAFFVWRGFFAGPGVPDSIVPLSGRIEGDDSAVAPKVTGRILEVRQREGDTVKAGDIIAVLDDEQVRAREQAARSALSAAQANAKMARTQIDVLEQQLKQNQLLTGQAKLNTEGSVHQAEADLAAAQADLAQRQAAYDLAVFDRDAYTRLAKTGAVSQRQAKLAVSTAEQDAAAVEAAKRRVTAAQGSLTMAQANLANPSIRESQVVGVEKQIAAQQAQIASVTADMQMARAQLAEAEANRQDLTIRAPFDGTIMTRAAEPGEVVQAGTAIVTLLNLRKVYLRGFVPEGQIGKIAIGQPAHVYLDSNPKQALNAYVARIDPEATFTPENTYFRDDRVKQVVGLKLQLKDGFGFAKPGMPADGEILVKGSVWPRSK
jgi:HlyD family secretion protein